MFCTGLFLLNVLHVIYLPISRTVCVLLLLCFIVLFNINVFAILMFCSLTKTLNICITEIIQ